MHTGILVYALSLWPHYRLHKIIMLAQLDFKTHLYFDSNLAIIMPCPRLIKMVTDSRCHPWEHYYLSCKFSPKLIICRSSYYLNLLDPLLMLANRNIIIAAIITAVASEVQSTPQTSSKKGAGNCSSNSLVHSISHLTRYLGRSFSIGLGTFITFHYCVVMAKPLA